MKKLQICIVVALSVNTLTAVAEIYKRVDAQGRVTYSNYNTGNAERLDLGIEEQTPPKKKTANTKQKASTGVSKSQSSSNRSYSSSVSQKTQSRRDETRKQILLDEYNFEKEALALAKQAYKEGVANPEIFRRRNADGSVSTFRNVPKYKAKIDRLKTTMESHQRNIELLEKELNAL